MSSLPSDQGEHGVAFKRLFAGRTDAYGTGKGRWYRTPPTLAKYQTHLRGQGDGLGIAPLLDDGTVMFASIDLDEPNFDLAREMQRSLRFPSFLERSRSGNAHVHVFFDSPIQAWVPRGLMLEACAAHGRRDVEVFPKQDRLREGMLGNYINLPFFGPSRPVFEWCDGEGYWPVDDLADFVKTANERGLNSPAAWFKRLEKYPRIKPPEEKLAERRQWGIAEELHICCRHNLVARDGLSSEEELLLAQKADAVGEGHRAVFFFSMAKMLLNHRDIDADMALDLLLELNDEGDRVDPREVARIVGNAERGQFTSTGCDDPLFLPYAHPDCPIAFPSARTSSYKRVDLTDPLEYLDL